MTKEERREYKRQWCIANPDKVKKYAESTRQWWKNHPNYHKEWMGRNRLEWNKKRAAYEVNRRKSDTTVALIKHLRDRLRNALDGNFKRGSAVGDLGCSIKQFKKHIELQFQEGMTWDNHGKYGWHLDHKIPLSKFDLTDRQQLLIALNYTNYQPLWAKDNLSKHDLHVMDFRDGMF